MPSKPLIHPYRLPDYHIVLMLRLNDGKITILYCSPPARTKLFWGWIMPSLESLFLSYLSRTRQEKPVRRQLSDISCQIGQLSDRKTVSADNCQWGQLSVGTTVSGTTVSGPWTTVRGNCQCSEKTVRSYSCPLPNYQWKLSNNRGYMQFCFCLWALSGPEVG